MRMDMDCIRDILFQAEENSFSICYDSYEDKYDDESLLNFQFVKKYPAEKLLYHINLANEFGLIKIFHTTTYTTVSDLSTEGHLFLANIREDNVWNKTKEISNKLGATSLDAVKTIATNVISGLILNYFQR